MVYLLVCRTCALQSEPLPIPFGSAEERGKWAAAHKRGTGHDRWWVHDGYVSSQEVKANLEKYGERTGLTEGEV